MRVINQNYLDRGKALVDFGFDRSGGTLEVAELIGVVCAYLAKGLPIDEIEQQLGKALSPEIGARARLTFDLFEDWQGRGLWSRGPAENDVTFSNGKLRRLYPPIGLEAEAHRVNRALSPIIY